MANHTLVAVDLAKTVFEVAVSHYPGQVAKQRRVSREHFLETVAQLPRATVVMEACGSAHFWARRIQTLGQEVVVLPPHAVRPYVRRDKTDRTDTKGMLEAYRNDEIRSVPIKSVAQQTLASLHRLRSGWLAERTARINTARGLLREFRMIIPVGARHVVPAVWARIKDATSEIPDPLRPALAELCEEIDGLERRIKMVEGSSSPPPSSPSWVTSSASPRHGTSPATSAATSASPPASAPRERAVALDPSSSPPRGPSNRIGSAPGRSSGRLRGRCRRRGEGSRGREREDGGEGRS
jgi:hypothetical protein